jgi:hypothetical protein
MTTFRPAPYSIAPDGAKAGPWMLRRYYLATLLESDDFAFLFPYGRHFATYAVAASRLPEARKEYPTAQVTSLLLVFDPKDPAQVAAFERLAAEGDAEAREPHR